MNSFFISPRIILYKEEIEDFQRLKKSDSRFFSKIYNSRSKLLKRKSNKETLGTNH